MEVPEAEGFLQVVEDIVFSLKCKTKEKTKEKTKKKRVIGQNVLMKTALQLDK